MAPKLLSVNKTLLFKHHIYYSLFIVYCFRKSTYYLNYNNSCPMLRACTLCYLWSLLCEIDQLKTFPMKLISQFPILIISVRIPNSCHFWNMSDSNILCNDPFVVSWHKSHQDLANEIPMYSIGNCYKTIP